MEREDEQPTVVVLKPGDIGPEEYKAYKQSMKGIIIIDLCTIVYDQSYHNIMKPVIIKQQICRIRMRSHWGYQP